MKVTVTGAIGSSPKRKEEKEEEKGVCIHVCTYIWKRKEGRRDRADGLDEKFIYTESV